MQVAFDFSVCTGYGPFGLIVNPVFSYECKGRKCFASVVSHKLARISDGDFFISVAGVALHFGSTKTGRVGIECQTDGVENGGFAGTCLACNQKHFTGVEWFLFKINGGIFKC